MNIKVRLERFWKIVGEFIPGIKHPDTPLQVFQNARSFDKQRQQLGRRCLVCDYTLPKDSFAVKELTFECSPGKCLCPKPYPVGLKVHEVCELCDSMYRSLYVNYGLTSMNYFKNFDDVNARIRGNQ